MPSFIAIGDIHGMDAMLASQLEHLPVEGTLVFLGDYIDRGPDSRQVIDRLLGLAETRACIFLRGNHEAMALAALQRDRRMVDLWLDNGGVATLESYGGPFPAAHVAFMEATRPFYTTEDYIFVHGGLAPGEQPEETDPERLWWIREPFLHSGYDWGRLVIHGHTPTWNGTPEVRPNRINIDTGAVYGGALTAVLLPERQFVSVT